MTTTVSFDRAKLLRFKHEYVRARAMRLEVFEFDGQQYVTEYAKYLIEHLAGQFRREGGEVEPNPRDSGGVRPLSEVRSFHQIAEG